MTTVFVDRANKFAVVDSRQTTITARNSFVARFLRSTTGKKLSSKYEKKSWWRYLSSTKYSKTCKIYEGVRVQKERQGFCFIFTGDVRKGQKLYHALCVSNKDTTQVIVEHKDESFSFWLETEDGEYLHDGKEFLNSKESSWWCLGSILDTKVALKFQKLPTVYRTEKVVCQVLRYASLFDKFSDNDYKIYRW